MTRDEALVVFHALLDNNLPAVVGGQPRTRPIDVRQPGTDEHVTVGVPVHALSHRELRDVLTLAEQLDCEASFQHGEVRLHKG